MKCADVRHGDRCSVHDDRIPWQRLDQRVGGDDRRQRPLRGPARHLRRALRRLSFALQLRAAHRAPSAAQVRVRADAGRQHAKGGGRIAQNAEARRVGATQLEWVSRKLQHFGAGR
jgi:hypothetical protein